MFISLVSIFVAVFVLGKYPEYFWIIFGVVNALLNSSLCYSRYKAKSLAVLLDLPGIISTIYLFITLIILAHKYNIILIEPLFSYINSNPWIFLAIFGLSCGTLPWTMLYQTASVKSYDPLFINTILIHVFSCLLMWSVKWYSEKVCLHDLPLSQLICPRALACGELPPMHEYQYDDMLNFFTYYALFYLLWWAPYTIWLLFFGIHHHRATTGYTTAWSHLLEYNNPLRNIVASAKNNNTKSYAYVYQLFHALISMWSFVIAFICYHSFIFHSILCILLLLYGTYAICSHIASVVHSHELFEKSLKTKKVE